MKRFQFVFYLAALILAYSANIGFAQTSGTSYKFLFGQGKTVPGYIRVKTSSVYSKQAGYGFDFGTSPVIIERNGKNPLISGVCTSNKPFYFSVYLPEGNYRVKMTLGDLKAAANTTVRAESRRLMLEKIQTNPGQFITRTFTVNMRVPEIKGTNDKVKLKPRELTKLNWDDKLTFEFNGSRPCISSLEITPVTGVVTVYLAGNSTVVDQDDEPWASWGQMITKYFKPEVVVSNQAESGLTLGSFLADKRLEKVLSTMKAGDYLFIEFGHNDQKDKLPNALDKYRERLKTFISKTREKGGIPVVVTSTNRLSFDSTGRIINTLAGYPDAARQIAKEENVALIDLNAMTKVFYEALGVEKSQKAFVIYPAGTFPGQTTAFNDHTHFNSYGAYELARCIVEGIRANKLGLSKYLRDGLPAFDPAHPDPVETFSLPLSPKSSVIKPDGN
ncbi:MAG: rhamnogalacturonan acetylesterase [Bacteroidota bacterium]|nr:rhamnogalacturonan acetylesterase [Bacteroidota bacterium]